MGLRAATACIVVVGLIFAACGRRGNPIAPTGRHLKAPPLGLNLVGRIGPDRAGFAADTTATAVHVEWLTTEAFHCGTEPLVASDRTTAYTSIQSPPFEFALPETGDAYLRVFAPANEPSRWVYVPPVTTVPREVTFTTRIQDGVVHLQSHPDHAFMAAEKLQNTWRPLGRRQGEARFGPYPPGQIAIISAHPVTTHRGGLSFAADAVTFVVNVE